MHQIVQVLDAARLVVLARFPDGGEELLAAFSC